MKAFDILAIIVLSLISMICFFVGGFWYAKKMDCTMELSMGAVFLITSILISIFTFD